MALGLLGPSFRIQTLIIGGANVSDSPSSKATFKRGVTELMRRGAIISGIPTVPA